ncbi:unnamed protein product [Prunus brigantina]
MGQDQVLLNKKVERTIVVLLKKEEVMWRQRSRVAWLKEGDKNTRDMKRVLEVIEPHVTHQMNYQLLQPFTRTDVETALFHMYPTKAPGHDGMLAFFYQHYWHIVGDEAFVNRLLPSIISESQSDFVPQRLILDNVMAAFEIMHFMKGLKKGQQTKMAIKLDMAKAYDRVEWSFFASNNVEIGICFRVGKTDNGLLNNSYFFGALEKFAYGDEQRKKADFRDCQ